MAIARYFDNYNPELLKLIPPDAKTVLEIGCGAGALCEAYRRINQGGQWIGIESNKEACEIASTRLTFALNSPVEVCFFDDELLPEHQADVLILGDILEHLADPLTHLQRLIGFLAPGAQVLASIPNAQHWSMLRNLMAGEWPQTDDGLFDRTHLRWFTRKSIEAMFAEAGLHVFEIRGQRLANQGIEQFLAVLDEIGPEAAYQAGVDLKALRLNCQVLQWVVRAVKPKMVMRIEDCEKDGERVHLVAIRGYCEPEPVRKLHVHAVLAEGCCARPRILEPFAMLGTIPGVKCTTGTVTHYSDFPHAEIVIQQRFRSYESRWQTEMIARGMLIVAELDDDPDGLQGYAENDYMQLRAVHAVQVSTERLAETVRKYNPNVMVFENQIADLPPLRDFQDDGEISVFYGAQNRESDWVSIMPAINRIIREHRPDNLVFRVINDKAFFDALETGQKTFDPFLPYDHYREILRSCDIALLPLKPTRFNEHKSDIKFLECAAEGVAMLASPTVYENTNKAAMDSVYYIGANNLFGAIYSEPSYFEDGLRTLIDHPDTRARLATNNYAYVRDHRLLSQHFRQRHQWYLDLLGRKSELTNQLLQRVPELARLQSGLPVSQT